MMVRDVLWVGSFVGLQFFRDVVIGDMWAFLLDIFVAVVSLRSAVYFLFPPGDVVSLCRPLPYGGVERA